MAARFWRNDILLALIGGLSFAFAATFAEEPAKKSREDELKQAAERLAKTEAYDLRYKFAAGDELRYRTEHLSTVETRIQGVTQTAKCRSGSTKVWRVTKVDEKGNATFTHMVDDVDMWQQVTGREEQRYSSKTDKVAPPGYETVASSVGVPLADITIDVRGLVVKRDNKLPQFTLGQGQLTLPLPPRPVKIGEFWNLPVDVRVQLESGQMKVVSTRVVYELKQVLTGVATIGMKTEVLTPINDQAVEAQLVQRLLEGEIKFDMDAGRVLSQELRQDKTVLAFKGAESRMQYLARYTEQLEEPREPSTKPVEKQAAAPAGPAPK